MDWISSQYTFKTGTHQQKSVPFVTTAHAWTAPRLMELTPVKMVELLGAYTLAIVLSTKVNIHIGATKQASTQRGVMEYYFLGT